MLSRVLQSIAPKRVDPENEKQVKTLVSVAQMAERYESYKIAQALLEKYAERVPAGALELARFHALHGDCDKAVDLMKRLYKDNIDGVVQVANQMLTKRRDEFGDKYDKLVDQILRAALREDPDSVLRQLARAESYETQGKHDESIAAYERLLGRDDLPVRMRALAKNNLGFQLGLLERRVDEAEQMVNEAIETFGPVEDMLDTRAVVRIALQKYDLAIEDLELAISVSNDPIKHFHLAKAYALAGDGQSAANAWEKAQSLGFEMDALPRLEQLGFEGILQKIESFASQNASL